MRLVPEAVTFPSRCAAVPFIGAHHERGYVDTMSEIPASAIDSHIYISVVAVEDMARLIGWSSPAEVSELEECIGRLEREKDQAESEAAEADAYLGALDVLESAGFRARKKPGRPRKVEEEAVA